MEVEHRPSGLVVPKQKPQPETPKRRLGHLEIEDEDRRQLARTALGQLAKAMNLSSPSHMRLPGTDERYAAHWQAWHFVGKMLLGNDRPDIEVKC